jgi:hypothetical protein
MRSSGQGRARWAALALSLLTAAAAQAQVPDEAVVHSGLRLGITGGLSLTPPPHCSACPYYRGLGAGFGFHAGWALHSDLALDLAATSGIMMFADDSSYGLTIYDVGAVAYRDRDWIRFGAGAAKWDVPVIGHLRRFGGGVSLAVGRELGYGRLKLGLSARLLVATTRASLLSTVLFMCDLSRS